MCCCPMWQACLAAAQASVSRAVYYPISISPSHGISKTTISRLLLPPAPEPAHQQAKPLMGSPTLAFPFWSFGLIWPCSPYSYATLPFPALTTPDWALLAAVLGRPSALESCRISKPGPLTRKV
ncbi:hypothetical protein K456DRAFT_818047 [Colletotrichum gloeosporioides 23]|nr:hypothetical protein K456DRAFT_818047 [Colletotrichum gloeosporioides 23]